MNLDFIPAQVQYEVQALVIVRITMQVMSCESSCKPFNCFKPTIELGRHCQYSFLMMNECDSGVSALVCNLEHTITFSRCSLKISVFWEIMVYQIDIVKVNIEGGKHFNLFKLLITATNFGTFNFPHSQNSVHISKKLTSLHFFLTFLKLLTFVANYLCSKLKWEASLPVFPEIPNKLLTNELHTFLMWCNFKCSEFLPQNKFWTSQLQAEIWISDLTFIECPSIELL